MKFTTLVMTLALVGFVAQADNHAKPAAPATDAATTAAPATEGDAATTTPTAADAHKDMKKKKPTKKGAKAGHEEKK